jgi:hypothetical protein
MVNHVKQVRKIRPTRRSVSGAYMFHGKTAIQYESTLERDFLIRFEHDRHVLTVTPQPCQLIFKADNGQCYPYTPDFHITFSNKKPWLIEVKPESEWRAHWREWLPKWKAAWRYANERGWVFHIQDESRIRDQTFANLKWLDRYTRMHLTAMQSESLMAKVAAQGNLQAKAVAPAEQAYLWHLLAVGRLDCDMTKPLSGETLLWISSHGG